MVTNNMRGRMTNPMRLVCAMAVALAVCMTAWVGAQETTAVTPTSTLARRAPGVVSAVLERPITVHLWRATLRQALEAIAAAGGVALGYSEEKVPTDKAVSLVSDHITVRDALSVVLEGTGLEVFVTQGGWVTLEPRSHGARGSAGERRQPSTGTLTGRVTDAKTGLPIPHATVLLEGTEHRVTTSDSGVYRITNILPGTYTAVARLLGYVVAQRAMTVPANQSSVVDFALERSPSQLDQVVVTGTVVPTEVKALPTPISVISDSDIARLRPHDVQELFRQAVPTAVSWDLPNFPFQTAFSVRGSSTLTAGSGQMKVFVDGVEVASPGFAAVDPASIERIEVIRGPQAAAIYGSDAIGGVIQVLTKRGDPNVHRPQVNAEAALGVLQTPYTGFRGVLRQTYAGSVQGSGPDVNYNFGAGYAHIGDYLPNGEISKQSNPSVYGGVHFARGILEGDLNGRYFAQNTPSVLNPNLSQTGLGFFSKPLYQPLQNNNQTVGARITVTPTSWLQHTVTVGIDAFTQSGEQNRPRLTTPGDTLLSISYFGLTKTSIGYNASVHGAVGEDVSGSLTAGFDHYSLVATDWSTSGALTTTGAIQTDPTQPISADRNVTDNTGYFAQAQLAIHDVLFFTGGLRAEHNTNFGDSLGTPVSPRFGLSFVQEVASVTLKLRSSWGRAIRPPNPGEKLGSKSSAVIYLANPTLGPERQQGWDTGVDAIFGNRGSLSVTYYNQTAENLIQLVRFSGDTVPTNQFQNIGGVKNTGVEAEGALQFGPAQLKGQYGYARARVARLAPNYAGDLRIGDQTLITPTHTAGASLSVAPFRGASVVARWTYVGSWNQYDDFALFRCFAGTGPCRPASRNYIIAYPGFVKMSATVSQQITSVASGFISVDNLTNNHAFELTDFSPVMGRMTMAGLRITH